MNGKVRVTGSVALSSPLGPRWSPSSTPNGNKPVKFKGEPVEILVTVGEY